MIVSKQQYVLDYDQSKWQETYVLPINTLQIFITNRCNLRCKGCFYSHKLDNSDMSLDTYRSIIDKYSQHVGKITLLGGEPLLHPQLGDIISENSKRGLLTTIYTNGRYLDVIKDIPNYNVDLRIGVLGSRKSEKPLSKVQQTDWPVKIVLMLRKDNVLCLNELVSLAESRFNCKSFYISSIRDIAITNDYWEDTPDTISNNYYAEVVQSFINRYYGKIPRIDIATRGVLKTNQQDFSTVKHCRFGNIFPDGEKIICPLDIAKRNTTPELTFNTRLCNKHTSCVLQKISLYNKGLT
jgi:hypothetical protein